MARTKLEQLAEPVDLVFTAGEPFSFTIETTGATLSDALVTMTTPAGDSFTTDPGVPTVTLTGGSDITVAFSEADSAALNTGTRPKAYKYAVRCDVEGNGPFSLLGGTITVDPVGTTGTSTTSSTTLAITLGDTVISLALALGATGPAGAAGAAGTFDNAAADFVVAHRIFVR